MKSLSLVLKITERCNLNCSYCYYFNGLDQSYKDKPAVMSKNTLATVIDFLLQGIKELGVDKLSIILHGGEPLLIPKDYFDYICSELILNFSFLSKFRISVQSNGVLIDKDWIDIFKKHDVKLGISLDGLQEDHDQYRIDHKRRGSYNRIVENISLLHEENLSFGILSVINPAANAQKIFQLFIDELKITGLNFLLPDFTHDRLPTHNPIDYGVFMSDILEEWAKRDDPNIKIMFINSYLEVLLGGSHLNYGHGVSQNNQGELHIFAIRGDGALSPTDELMSTDPATVTHTNLSVFNSSLKEFLNLPIFKELDYFFSNAPTSCKKCCWEKICGGGTIVNRFSRSDRFNNPSVYCDGLKLFYTNLMQYLLNCGFSKEQLSRNLLG